MVAKIDLQRNMQGEHGSARTVLAAIRTCAKSPVIKQLLHKISDQRPTQIREDDPITKDCNRMAQRILSLIQCKYELNSLRSSLQALFLSWLS